MDRAEAAGLGVAAAGHAALLAAISLGFAATRLPAPQSDPIEVSFVEDVGLTSTAPTPSPEEPAARPAPEEAPAEAAMPVPPQVQPVPQPEPAARPPAPSPQPAPRSAQPKRSPAPAKPAPRPIPSRKPFDIPIPDSNEGSGRSQSASPPAAAAGPAVEASLVAEVRRQLKPHWQRAVPTGADAEALRTELSLTLARDGRVTSVDVVRTTGITASNRPQVALHQERARRAVTLASPFNLPDKYYDAWRQLNVTLDLRLSQ